MTAEAGLFWGLDLIAKPAGVADYHPMDTHREQRINDLRTQIARGDYVVDPARTAHAIIGCVSALALAHAEDPTPPVRSHERRRIRGGVRGAARRCRGMTNALAAAVR
jgi:Anti-sigma-28 factor, FlgM